MAPTTSKHKAIAINIMFSVNQAVERKYFKDHDSDAWNKKSLLDHAPDAVTEVLEKRYHVEIPAATVAQYLLDIQENARQKSITWDQKAVTKHIGSLIGSLSDSQQKIKKDISEVAHVFTRHHANKENQKESEKLSEKTRWLMCEALSVSKDADQPDKIALQKSWETLWKPTSSDISDPDLKYPAPQDPSSASVAEQVANRDMSDSPPEA